MLEIRELPQELRPREVLAKHGAGMLSDTELLAVILGSGTRDKGVGRLAAEVLELLEANNYLIEAQNLLKIKGLGKVKAAQLAASLEFARRALYPERKKIKSPGDIYPLVNHYGDRKQEYFISLSLNGAHEVTAVRVVSVGLVNRAMVHPREVFADVIQDRAAAVVCCHNHPSGNLDPSLEDREVTRRLKESGEILGVPLLDHVIFSEKGYYSFVEAGEL